MKTVSLIVALAASAAVASAQPQAPSAANTVATAPLPVQLAMAQKIFIGNAGDQENADCLRAYNTFYAGINGLGRFQLVLDPKDADLALELHYEIGFGAGVNGGSPTPRQFRVVIVDPKTRIILWSLTERTNYAVFQKNRDKNLDETMAALVNDFNLLSASQPVAPSNHSVVRH